MNVDKRNQIISIVLAVVIVGLGYYLYRSIHDPYQAVLEREAMTERVRHRMSLVRDALREYEQRYDEFPPTEGGLDTLVQWVRTDSLISRQADSLFAFMPPSSYHPDSLVISPRPPHNRFEYTLNDTLRPPIYLLQDPDSEDNIGDLTNTTELNAASWE